MTRSQSQTWALRQSLARQAQSDQTATCASWARTVARHLELPLAVVLGWPKALLEEEIARVLLSAARNIADRHLRDETEPPESETDLLARATRAILRDLKEAKRREEEAASEAALDRLMREG